MMMDRIIYLTISISLHGFVKKQIQVSDIYFTDLTGFIQRFMNQSAPRSGQKGTPRSRARGETGRRERRGSHSGKNGLIMTGRFPSGMQGSTRQMSSLVLVRGLLMDRFKSPLLGEAETVSLSVMTWGLARVTPCRAGCLCVCYSSGGNRWPEACIRTEKSCGLALPRH